MDSSRLLLAAPDDPTASSWLQSLLLHAAQVSYNQPTKHNIALRSVVGVRRHVDSTRRPHCFEIALMDSSRLLLAAPDDPTASSWLQSLLLHAAQVSYNQPTNQPSTTSHYAP
ncbi:hypothetical protein O0L34_g341 [Tuta absoluta]|nr:hypothetical protein O0L34_g341 [Tuta absoluta]